MSFKYVADFIDSNLWNIKAPYNMVPSFIVVHNTANDASAKDEISYMRNNKKEVSFHYAIDDVEVRQALPINRNAWHAGDGDNGNGNRNGIAIEICYSNGGGARFNSAEDNAAHFIAYLLKEQGWGIDRVKKHQDFSGKYCPHRTLDLGWDRFLNKVKSYMEFTSPTEITGKLSSWGIVSDTNGMIKAMEAEPNGRLYWLARKACKYIMEMKGEL